jgi:hypothetical protein
MAQHHPVGQGVLIIDAPRSYSGYAGLTKQIKGFVYRTRPPVRLSACDVALGCLHKTSHKSLTKSCRPAGASHVKIGLVAAVLYWRAERVLKRTFHISWPISVKPGTQDPLSTATPSVKVSYVTISPLQVYFTNGRKWKLARNFSIFHAILKNKIGTRDVQKI